MGKNKELNHFEVYREAQQIMALVAGLQMSLFTLVLQGKQAILDPMESQSGKKEKSKPT